MPPKKTLIAKVTVPTKKRKVAIEENIEIENLEIVNEMATKDKNIPEPIVVESDDV